MQRKDWGAHTSHKAKNSLCLLTVNLNVKSGEAWSFCHLQNSSFLNIFTLQQTRTSEQSFLNRNYTMQWNNCKLPHSSRHPLWCLLMKETTDAELIEIKISPCPFEGNRRQAIWGETRLRLCRPSCLQLLFQPTEQHNLWCFLVSKRVCDQIPENRAPVTWHYRIAASKFKWNLQIISLSCFLLKPRKMRIKVPQLIWQSISLLTDSLRFLSLPSTLSSQAFSFKISMYSNDGVSAPVLYNGSRSRKKNKSSAINTQGKIVPAFSHREHVCC